MCVVEVFVEAQQEKGEMSGRGPAWVRGVSPYWGNSNAMTKVPRRYNPFHSHSSQESKELNCYRCFRKRLSDG